MSLITHSVVADGRPPPVCLANSHQEKISGSFVIPPDGAPQRAVASVLTVVESVPMTGAKTCWRVPVVRTVTSLLLVLSGEVSTSAVTGSFTLAAGQALRGASGGAAERPSAVLGDAQRCRVSTGLQLLPLGPQGGHVHPDRREPHQRNHQQGDEDSHGTTLVLQPPHRMTPLPVRVTAVPKNPVM